MGGIGRRYLYGFDIRRARCAWRAWHRTARILAGAQGSTHKLDQLIGEPGSIAQLAFPDDERFPAGRVKSIEIGRIPRSVARAKGGENAADQTLGCVSRERTRAMVCERVRVLAEFLLTKFNIVVGWLVFPA